ncbi:hypothetical protein H1R13_07340 [Streptomyces mexicanus]|jgi:hypothetical protein|uniref:Uncharacterized protein n=1 Tax=Streptomyces mexicanus TaxID=178566 RepID=A0A7X1HX71_9ACTN|nr:hypothetical protein [Streptomyces mexicanus]MBC2864814.1 hypothetical protein [Streptomyces mexicanus]
MAYGAHHSPTPPPHPDLARARDCEHCLGWGTVITRDGDHRLCDTCQPDADGADPRHDVPGHRQPPD